MKSKVEKTPYEHILEQQMHEKFGASHIRRVFSRSPWLKGMGSRPTFGGISQPFFYESDHATVFSPVTDKDKLDQSQCETIQQTLALLDEALARSQFTLDKAKRMVFPVSEEQKILGLLPRNHWVTLTYDPNSETATLIDSRPQLYGYLYPTAPMQASLSEGLSYLGLSVREFNIQYQSIQHDDIHCGAWTTINIESLALGASVEQHLTALKAQDKEMVIQHLIEIACYDKKEPFQPNSMTPDTVTATNSTGSLNTLSSGEDYFEVEETCFEEQERATWIQTATELFNHCFTNPRALARALVARENLTYNGRKLTDDHLGQMHISALLDEIEQKYPDFSHTSMPDYERQARGYGIFNPRYVAAKLKDIGLDDDAIHAIRLSDMIRYDAAICTAMANAGHDRAYAYLQEQGADEAIIEKAHTERARFRLVLALALKDLVEQQQISERMLAEVPVAPAEVEIHAQHDDNAASEMDPRLRGDDRIGSDEGSSYVASHPLLPEGEGINQTRVVTNPPISADFQLQCIQALLITGCVLLAIAVLTCPPIAGILGMSGALATNISIAATGLGGGALLASAGLFATCMSTDTANTASPGHSNTL